MLSVLLAASSFVPPASRVAAPRSRAVRMEDEGFKLPKFELPKLDLGGIEFGEGEDKSKQKGLTPRDGDVQFVDTDGDTITLRKSMCHAAATHRAVWARSAAHTAHTTCMHAGAARTSITMWGRCSRSLMAR